MSRFHTSLLFETEYDPHCHFGIVSAPLAAFLAADVGLGVTGGAIGAGVLEGAGIGAAGSAIMGGDPLKGALTGGLTGGAVGAAGAFGLGAAGQTAAGAGAGALGAELTGGNPMTGALTGGAGGLIASSGALSGGSAAAPSAASATGSGATGALAAAPPSVSPPSGGPAADLTSAAAGAAGGTPVNSVFGSTEFGVDDFGGGSFTPPPTTTAGGPGVADHITGGGSTLGSIGGFIQKNPGVALGAGAIGLSALRNSQPSAYENRLSTAAGEAQTHASVLESYQLTGTLPYGLQATVDRYRDSAIAKIKGEYAGLGMGGGTAEAEAIANVHQTSAMSAATLADHLAKQGLAWDQLSSADLNSLMTAQDRRDQTFTNALTSFAAALGGSSLKTG